VARGEEIMRWKRKIDFVSRVLLMGVIGVGLLAVWGCGRERVGDITVTPSKSLFPGQSATLSIEVSGLGAHDVIQWKAPDGRFEKATDEPVTVWVAPNKPGPVVITCQVTSGGKITLRHLAIDVVERVATNPAGERSLRAQGQREGEQLTHAETAPRTPPPPGEPYDIEQGGFIPSGWMGDGEKGTEYVQVKRLSRDTPHSEPFSQMWTYTPGSGSVGWAAVAWQFPENNWGDKRGKDLRNRGFAKVTVWARGQGVIQFKAGGHTNPSKQYQASFAVVGDFITLTPEWSQYTLDIKGEDLSNVVSAFTWVMRAEDNPNGATFYLDDIRYE
jgi:hypothetical protein